MANKLMSFYLFSFFVLRLSTAEIVEIKVDKILLQDREENNQETTSLDNKFRLDFYNDLFRNDRPIIGILTQELTHSLEVVYKKSNYTSYLVASYVKFVESAGARAVPIHINRDEAYYEDVFASVNGILFPGGDVSLTTSGYASAARVLWNLALEANAGGDYFPIWGTCLGFEMMSLLGANGTDARSNCSSEDVASALSPTDRFRSSRLYAGVSGAMFEYMTEFRTNVNFHIRCLTPESFESSGLSERFRYMAVDESVDGVPFVSVFEHKNFPFYGTQFHPEKIPYEWTTHYKNIPHTPQAVAVTTYYATFFVNEARKNKHRFNNTKLENKSLIYSSKVHFTGRKGITFEQSYMYRN